MHSLAVLLFLVVSGSLCEAARSAVLETQTLVESRPHAPVSIINGNVTSISKYPYIASLKHGGSEFGAAVILNKYWLLTTGYNVINQQLSSLSFRVGSSFYGKQGQVLNVSKVIIHPKYTGGGVSDYNVALVKTSFPIKMGDNVTAVGIAQRKLKVGTKGWTAGWGSYDQTYAVSEVLREGMMSVYNWKECQQLWSTLTRRHLCTYSKTYNSLYYDFGNPLVVSGVVYGLFIDSYVTTDFKPNVFTDVASLHKWIEKTINSEESSQE